MVDLFVLTVLYRGELVFLEYINGLIPDIMIKWTKGSTVLIHMATTRYVHHTSAVLKVPSHEFEEIVLGVFG